MLVRRAGAKPWFDLFEIANELAYYRTDNQGLIVLFDWTHIAAWPYNSPCEEAIQAWKETAPPTDCAAFVNAPKFNRHVAILSALLRMHGAKVRSSLTQLGSGCAYVRE